jgi:hypothetical protein
VAIAVGGGGADVLAHYSAIEVDLEKRRSSTVASLASGPCVLRNWAPLYVPSCATVRAELDKFSGSARLG